MVDFSSIRGRKIDVIYDVSDNFSMYRSNSLKYPPEGRLASFGFVLAEEEWVYLDPYGNEIMPREVEEWVFGKGTDTSIDLAVNLTTGDVALVSLSFETEDQDEELVMYVQRLHDWATERASIQPETRAYRLPKKVLFERDLKEVLLSQKRPWSVSIRDENLFEFIERSTGYSDMMNHLIVRFDLRPLGGFLELWSNAYRWVTDWKDNV